MNRKKNIIALILLFIIIISCQTPPKKYRISTAPSLEVESVNMKVSHSAVIPEDGSAPIAGIEPIEEPSRIITFNDIGQKFEVKKGETVNFIYDGIDPELTYIIYESTYDGYNLQLAYRNENILITFDKLCQTYIVASPMFTSIEFPDNLMYEQIIWTPRADGSWEVRIGTTERGCKSKALKQLQKLRTKEYERNVPK